MMTEVKFKDFQFPLWTDIVESNKIFLDRNEYQGYCIHKCVSDKLYLLIDCQNESKIMSNGSDKIRFAWCTRGGFAISSVIYDNTEEGYLAGCAHLVQAAIDFQQFFSSFALSHMNEIADRIDKYNKVNN